MYIMCLQNSDMLIQHQLPKLMTFILELKSPAERSTKSSLITVAYLNAPIPLHFRLKSVAAHIV